MVSWAGVMTETAFSLKIKGKEQFVKAAEKEELDLIFATWKQGRIEVGREMFKEFPDNVALYVSKEKRKG